jgi:hypothetical protein
MKGQQQMLSGLYRHHHQYYQRRQQQHQEGGGKEEGEEGGGEEEVIREVADAADLLNALAYYCGSSMESEDASKDRSKECRGVGRSASAIAIAGALREEERGHMQQELRCWLHERGVLALMDEASTKYCGTMERE